MAPVLALVLAPVCRIDRPAANRSPRISLILRIVVLGAAIALSQKEMTDGKLSKIQWIEEDSDSP